MVLVKKIKDFAELIAFSHTLFSLPFIFIAMIVASNGFFGWRLFVLGIFAAVFARSFAMGFNRFIDRKFDSINPRTMNRPSVDGRLSPIVVALFTILCGIGFIITAYLINDLAFYLSFVFLPILAGYSLFKRFSSFAHLVLGLCLGLAPIAGAVAVLGTIPFWSVVLCIGVLFWVAGFDILYSLQDYEFDKNHNLFSIPSKFGEQNALNIAAIFHIFTIVFWAYFAFLIDAGFFIWLAVIIATVMLYFEHLLVRRDFRHIDKAFFTINGYLGIAFLILTIIEAIWNKLG